MKKALVGILLGGSCLLFSCLPMSEPYVKNAEKALNQVVKITSVINTSTQPYLCNGAGVFISPFGHILTCYHVVPSSAMIYSVSLYDGTIYPAYVIKYDSKNDLALIRIEKYPTDYAELEKSHNIKVGQQILAVGHPFDHNWTVTAGIVSALDIDIIFCNMLQTDAAINSGNSGGPLYNLKGKIVGILSLSYNPLGISMNSGLSFAIEPSTIREFLLPIPELRYEQ